MFYQMEPYLLNTRIRGASGLRLHGRAADEVCDQPRSLILTSNLDLKKKERKDVFYGQSNINQDRLYPDRGVIT